MHQTADIVQSLQMHHGSINNKIALCPVACSKYNRDHEKLATRLEVVSILLSHAMVQIRVYIEYVNN